MEKKLFQSISNSILAVSLSLLMLTSCSSDKVDPDVVFSNLKASKTKAYIEETIILDIEGTGYSKINVTTTNPSVTITKIAATSYEIAASKATSASIKVELTNDSKIGTKSQTLDFYEHGVSNFNTVEGIKVDVSTSELAKTLLGEPDYKNEFTSSTSVEYESWKYLSKGIELTVLKSNGIVTVINLFGNNYYYTNSDNVKKYYTNYPYEIGNGWKINDSATTMDMVISSLGTPLTKNSSVSGSSLNVSYQYTISKYLTFHFYSDSVDNSKGKKIILFTVN